MMCTFIPPPPLRRSLRGCSRSEPRRTLAAARGTRRGPGRSARMLPSSTLSAIPAPSGVPTQISPSAPPFAIQPGRRRIRSVSIAPRSYADQLRVRRHRRDDPGAAVELGEPRERVRHPLERQPEGEHAAAVDRDGHVVRRHLGGGGDLGEERRAASDDRRAGSPRSASRARGRRRGTRRACRSSCARAGSGRGRPAGRARGRPRSRAPWSSSARAASSCARLGAVRRARDRELDVRDVGSLARRAAAPGAASRTTGRT